MIINSDLINQFTDDIKKPDLKSRSIANPNDVLLAVCDVYGNKSIIARIMTGRPKIDNPELKAILKYIANRIFAYLTKSTASATQDTFDKLHHELCDYFMSQYNATFVNDKTIPIEYGIAQKLINMVFKYLSCYSDYVKYSGLFAFCHMPIDSYILYYFYKHEIVQNCQGRFAKSMTSPTAKYLGQSWSKLNYQNYVNLVNEYRKSLIKTFPDLSMLHLEYYIWSNVKRRIDNPIVP